MSKQGPLTNKVFKQLPPENEKLSLLDNQMVDLTNDFEDMKRNREEAKKQLEAKFQDVHRKIQNTRDFVTSEGQRINNTMVAFQSKFESLLGDASNSLQLKTHTKTIKEQHDQYATVTGDRLDSAETYLNDLDSKLKEEKDERLKQSDENLREIRKQLSTLFEYYETEKNTRVDREKDLMQTLSDKAFALNEKMDDEKSDRIMKCRELKDFTDQEIIRQKKNTVDFNTKTIDEFNHVASNLEREMDQRFSQQNQIVDNLSNVIKTIQDTLKIIGKGV